MAKVKMYADNAFRYRLHGSRSWISLSGGEWHYANFNDGDRVEFSSTSSVANIKIIGAVSNINIEKSELSSLDGSFERNKSMSTAVVNSSTQIETMDSSFADSGIVTLTLDSSNIKSAVKAFENTKDLRVLNFDSSNLKDSTDMFAGSKVESIDSLSNMRDSTMTGMFDDAKNLRTLASIDLRDSLLTSEDIDVSEDLMVAMGIEFSRKKIIVNKIYSVVEDNVIDDDYSFELDIQVKELTKTRESTPDVNDGLSTDIDGSQNIELDIKVKGLEKTRESTPDVNDGLDSVIDVSQNIELDIKVKNEDLPNPRREPVIVDTGLDTSIDSVNYTLEMDIERTHELLPISRREPVVVNTGLDTSIDSLNYTLEMDVQKATDPLAFARREPVVVDTGLDTTSDSSNYTFEMDIHKAGLLDIARREPVTVDTGLDTTSDPSTYTLEMDIFAGYEDIDPFGDGSCVYYVGRDNQTELIEGSTFSGYSGGWMSSPEELRPGRYGKVHRPQKGVEANPITNTDALKNLYRNIYIQFDRVFHPSSSLFTSLFRTILEGDGAPHTKFAVYERYYNGQTTLKIIGNPGDYDSAQEILFDEIISTGAANSYGAIAIIETAVDSGSYRVIVNGVDAGGFDFTMTIEPSSSEKVYINAQHEDTETSHTHCRTMVFNRPLTIDDVRYLDDKLTVIKG
jgi:hypothetical protein